MKTVGLAAGLTAVVVGASLLVARWVGPLRGPEVHVLFRSSWGIEAGDPVTWNDVEIGKVGAVALDGDQVRVDLLLDPEHASKLPGETTFKIERHGFIRPQRRVEVHVLKEDSPPIRDGATVEGVETGIELAMRRGGQRIGEIMERGAERARRAMERVEREMERINWEKLGQEMGDRGDEIARRINELAETTGEEARRSWDELRPQLDGLLAELDSLKDTESARELRRLAERLDAWARQNDKPAPPPELPEAPPPPEAPPAPPGHDPGH